MRHTFPKTERLTTKKLIDRLFDRSAQTGEPEGVQTVYAHPFRVLFLPANVPEGANDVSTKVPPCQVLFSVPKRAFKKAVDRNLVRRRCREAYRLNKRILQQAAPTYPAAITFLYTAKTKISFEEIEKGMKLALKRIKNEELRMKS